MGTNGGSTVDVASFVAELSKRGDQPQAEVHDPLNERLEALQRSCVDEELLGVHLETHLVYVGLEGSLDDFGWKQNEGKTLK
jgi:hypothetical protein